MKVTAGGGNADLEYRFWAYDRSTGIWTMLRDYSPDATFLWNTNPTQRGQYIIQVWARETGTTGEPQAWLSQDVELLPARVLLFRGASPAETQTEGQSFVYTVNNAWFWWSRWPVWEEYPPQGELARFGVTLPESWSVLFPWGTILIPGRYENSSVGVHRVGRPDCSYGLGPTGRMTVHEYTKLADGGMDRLAMDFEQTCPGSPVPVYGGFRWNSTIDTLALSAVTSAPYPPTAGAPVTATAIGSSSTEPVEFKFWVRDNATGTWTMIRDYAAAHTATWTPATAGSYLVQVWMRRQGQTADYERWLNSGTITVY